MKRAIGWLLLLASLAGLAYLVWQKTRPQPLEVVVQAVLRGNIEKIVANTRAGTVNACRRAKLSPSIGGQIARLPIKEGDLVKTGDLLLEIWNEDLSAQLDLAKREVTVARAQAESACFSAEEARRLAKRSEQLFRSKVSSEEEADRAATQAKSLQAQCTASWASVEMGLARIRVAEANLSRTRLIAPFGGIIAKIEGELNEYVTPSPVGVLTPPAVDLIENSCYYISAPIDEVDAAEVAVGMTCRIRLDAFRDKHFQGRVRRISPFVLDIEKQARTVEIEAAFVEEADFRELLAGYSADVEVVISSRKDTLTIPSEALVDGKRVYIFDITAQKISAREVKVGLANWALTEVLSGLEENQLVVVNVDLPGIKDGASAVLAGEKQ